MAVIPRTGNPYPETVKRELDQLAAEWPSRDFWYVGSYAGLDSWSSRPTGERCADVIRFSPEAVRAELEEASGG